MAHEHAMEDTDYFPKTDLALVVEGKTIHVNKEVLKRQSSVFRAKVGEAQESNAIELPDKKYEDVIVFLRSFYPNMEIQLDGMYVLDIDAFAPRTKKYYMW